ncbi:Uncharacterised protein [Mycobacterium tuberculosis]|uniref:Uncharacterized protein n=1 Tax=Mycobacterium tuberculosis TaxID=1773 RepID=A0A654U2N5_MYCTX|nr:Uncharacterised protein [Mycobacterium tuberculosis]
MPPLSAAMRSAILSAVNVLPVPQAMISLPRSLPTANPRNTASIACCWCGRSSWRLAGVRFTCRSPAGQAMSQSIGDSAISAMPMRCTGTN